PARPVQKESVVRVAAVLPDVSPPDARWLQGPAHDVAMAFIWLPFGAAALACGGDPRPLRWLVSGTLLLSLAHQPLTLWLVYGDAGQRRAHLPLFTWAPAAAAVAVVVGLSVSPVLVAVVAGLWNLVHTLRQRYGIARLYGRMSAIDC